MRGKQDGTGIFILRGRITPAYAGKTRLYDEDTWECKDHPRVCGENGEEVVACVHPIGSPPRMRGKPQVQGVTAVYTGITPAYAGKTPAF